MSDTESARVSHGDQELESQPEVVQNELAKNVETQNNEDGDGRRRLEDEDPDKTISFGNSVNHLPSIVESSGGDSTIKTSPNSINAKPVVQDENANDPTPSSTISKSSSTAQTTQKKKDLMRPLFSRSSTTDKVNKNANNKTMIVETETVDASNVPSVTLPIGGQINNDIMTNTQTYVTNLASLRSKKSTLFVDQPSQVSSNAPNTSSNSVNQNEDGDNVSVNGSIRNLNKRLTQTDIQPHTSITTKPTTTKADFFAAKIANAVGDASDSDSEETFVYESAPDALNAAPNTLPTNKMITTATLNNPITLRKLNQRNLSMPVTSSNLHTFSLNNDDTSVLPPSHLQNSITNGIKEQPDDISIDSDRISLQNTEQPSELELDQQSLVSQQIRNQTSNNDSPNSTIHITNHDNLQNSTQVGPNPSQSCQQPHYIAKSNLDPSSRSISGVKKAFTKYNGDDHLRSTSNVSQTNSRRVALVNNSNQLRTTTSKLFDKKGGSLRRYSGVPDDVNIEDYIDQYDEENDIGMDDYSDTYDYDDYDDEDELTPLNVNIANNKLRNKMASHYFNKRSFSNFRSTDSGENSKDYGTLNNKDEGNSLNPNKAKPPRRHKSRSQQQRYQQTYSPHNFNNRRKNSSLQTFKNVMFILVFVFLLVSFGFIIGFLLATTKDLQNVNITSIEDVVVTVDELVFDVNVDVFNPGFVAIETNEIELDIFARSSYLVKENYKVPIFVDENDSSSVQTILLGTITEFETPLRFESGFFNRNNSTSKSTVKLLHPGQNSTDSDSDSDGDSDGNHKIENDTDKWKKIINNPFDLIVRGRLIYVLPFVHTERSVSVTKTISIDPSSKEVIAHLI